MATIKLTGFNTSTGRNTTAGDTDVVTLDGSLTIGNADTDAVIFNADIDSDFIPDDDSTYNIGTSTKKWAEVHCDDLYAYSNITFSDTGGTYPTNAVGFYWQLNTDEARIYAQQPSLDSINFYFKLSDNNLSTDRYIFWIEDYRGTSYDRYPLYMHGDEINIHAPPSGTSGTPDTANAKIIIPRGNTSGTTTTHKGRLFLDGDNSSDLYIHFQNNTENAYVFQDQSDSNRFKLESANDICFNTNGSNERMRIESTGDVGIGTTNPVYRLDVHDNTSTFIANLENDYTSAGADILRMKVNILNPSSSSALIYIYDSSNTGIYAVQGNGAGGSTVVTSFTAGHDSVIEQSVDVVPGMIVESTGEVWYKPTDITFETALPKIRLADSDGSKRVFGVIAGYVEQPEDEQEWVHNGFTMRPGFPKYGQIAGVGANEWNIGTMSIGEGCIWITNINGDVENGDLIESSVIKGYGRKQDDDIMRSKTVAKCTETIDWSLITDTIEYNGTAYKRCLVCCTFHCG